MHTVTIQLDLTVDDNVTGWKVADKVETTLRSAGLSGVSSFIIRTINDDVKSEGEQE